ncbi:MAG: hypothetical protein KF764_24400 [Labilithrix sp.]|nr:hypothetical protein [Labilithrix sp.]
MIARPFASLRPSALVPLALVSLLACGGAAADIADPDSPPPNGSGQGSSGSAAPDSPGDGDSPDGTTPSDSTTGPRVAITLRGSTAPFAHTDGWSGSTPKRQIVAIRSLYLLRSPTDASPVKVFDHGAKAVETDLVTGKKVEVASVVAKTLPAGVFTVAKAGVAYVRYSVAARMHSLVSVDGQYDNVQALSDGAVIDGITRDKGHFRYSFVASGTTYGTLEGEDAPVPAVSTSGGLTLDTSGPQSFYVFPVQVAIDPNVGVDHEVSLELNVHQSFRWQDQLAPGYSPKVFDTTPYTFEPVMAFGANALKLTIGPAAKL